MGNKVISYNTILQLHSKIQEFPELDLSADESQESGEISAGAVMQRTYMTLVKEIGKRLLLKEPEQITLLTVFSPPIPASARLRTCIERLC